MQQQEIPIHGVSYLAMNKLLDYIYTSEIELDLDCVQEVLVAATLVQVSSSLSSLSAPSSGLFLIPSCVSAARRRHRLLLRLPGLLAGREQRAGGASPGRRVRAAGAQRQSPLVHPEEHPDLLPDRGVPTAAPGRGLQSAEQQRAAGEPTVLKLHR